MGNRFRRFLLKYLGTATTQKSFLSGLVAVITFFSIAINSIHFSPVRAQVNPYEAPRIGVGGCSNTTDFLEKYPRYSTVDNVWHQNVQMGGGHLAAWADITGEGVPYWNIFQSNLQTYGAHSAWFMMCIRTAWTSPDGMTFEQQAMITTVVNHIRSLTSPNFEVYISPLNSYIDNDCSAHGPYGVANATELADWAAASGLGLRGPDLGPLTPEMVSADNCHPSSLGKKLGAEQIAAFFDQVDTSPDPTYWCVDGSVLVITDGSTPTGNYVAGPFDSSDEAGNDPGCVPPPPTAYWCVDGSVLAITDGSTPSGTYVAGPFSTEAEATNDPGCIPPPPAYWCVDGSVFAITDGSTPDGSYVAGPFNSHAEAQADPGCVPPPPPEYWCVDGSVVTVTDGSTPTGDYAAGPYSTSEAAAADPGCAPPPPAYWCVDGSVITVTDGTTPTGNYVAGPFATSEEAGNDPGCVPPPTTYWCVDGSVVTITDGSMPTGTYVGGPYGSAAEAGSDPGCLPPPPAYWCVDGAVLTVADGSTPSGGYVSGPFTSSSDASNDAGCVTPRISTSANPIYAGQSVTYTDYYTGTHKRRWTLGNGVVFSNYPSASLNYTYSTPGTYTITLETRDDSGTRVTLTRIITVLAP